MNRRTWLRSLAALAIILPGAGLLLLLAHSVLATNTPDWQRDGLPGVTVHFLAPGHTHHGLLFAAAEGGIYRRDASGSWQQVLATGAVWGVELLADDRTVLAGDQDGNVDISHDGGAHWQRHALTAEAVYAVTVCPLQPRTILAGAGSGLYLSRDGGRHWRRTRLLPNSAGTAFVWQGRGCGTVFAGTVAGGPGGETKVLVSRDGGATWQHFGQNLGSRGGIMALAIDPRSYLYAGTMGNTIWRVPLTGRTWVKSAQGIPAGQHVSGIAVVPGRPPRLYVGTLAAGIFRSQDAGRHWTNDSDGLPSDQGDRIVLSVAYAARDRTLYAATTDGVYRRR